MRYYISNQPISGGRDATAWRLPAPAFEDAVRRIVAEHLQAAAARHAILAAPEAGGADDLANRLNHVACNIATGGDDTQCNLIVSGTVHQEVIALDLAPPVLANLLQVAPDALALALLTISAPLHPPPPRRRDTDHRRADGRRARSRPDPHARQGASLGTADARGRSIAELARRCAGSEAYVRTRAQLAFLSPRSRTPSSRANSHQSCRSSVLSAPAFRWTGTSRRTASDTLADDQRRKQF